MEESCVVYTSGSNLRRNRIFRDRTNPFDVYDVVETDCITNSDSGGMTLIPLQGTLPPVLQAYLALRFSACEPFQDACAKLVSVHQSAACCILGWRTLP